MPPITRTFVKTSFIYFIAALATGLLLSLGPMLPWPRMVGAVSPVYFHLFMVGWVTQLIIGVAFWMFPKFTQKRPRGSEWLAWLTYAFLNSGLMLRILAEPGQVIYNHFLWAWLLVLSALLQWLGGMTFVLNTWPRVKEK
jgi:hypothetical protein